jgi:hypothetical protein
MKKNDLKFVPPEIKEKKGNKPSTITLPSINTVLPKIDRKIHEIILDESVYEDNSVKSMSQKIKEIDISKINSQKSGKRTKYYTLEELKNIAKDLGINNLTPGIKKETLVRIIMKKIEDSNS